MNKLIVFLFSCLVLWGGLTGCVPEMPITSVITIDAESMTQPTNKKLYGLSLEEINHAIDGGIYAELIQNRSFEDGVAPLNCAFDASSRMLTTPNGWLLPFIKPDSIPGWYSLSPNTFIAPDGKELINDKNHRSLLVSINASAETGRGGVVAGGYHGIPVRKGHTYNLSFYLKGTTIMPKQLQVALEDSATTAKLSDVMDVYTTNEWRYYAHTFTANRDVDNAVLTISSDTTAMFWLDVVSLFPAKTWNDRENGLKPELMEKIAALNPQFIRFPGGSFVEGYTAGTYPVWKETVGSIAGRKHFWNVWSYGTTNGMGYHEYLQMCEDLHAEPIYVINSGVTSQSRRPRYEDITAMDVLVKDALDAIAYANEPVDSIYGAMRAENGHAKPFGLKYVEVGSENYGQEYMKRFALFRDAIKKAYPDVMVISSSAISPKNREDWVDSHFYSEEDFYIANHNRYESDKNYRRSSGIFIGEFGSIGGKETGTLRNAIGEACFLIGVERAPEVVKRLAFSPVFANANFTTNRPAMASFNNSRVVLSPSYYMYQLFANNRGDEILKTEVETYSRPQVSFGRVGIEMFDNSFDFTDVRINNKPVADALVKTGGWQVSEGTLVPEANRWNYLLMGDPAMHDYEFSATIMRTKGSGQVRFRLRDNGLSGEPGKYIGMTLGQDISELYQQSGSVKDTLGTPVSYPLENNRSYKIRLVCKNDRVRCLVDDAVLHDVSLHPLPSLVSIATWDKKNEVVLLKVVNTTQHEEITELKINGLSVKNSAAIIQITGLPEMRNTFAQPEAVIPVKRRVDFPLSGSKIYHFPPNSITLFKLKVN